MPKTNNRKTPYFKEYFAYRGEQLKINANENHGIYKEPLVKTIEQLDCSIKIHKRILVLRFDLRLNIYTGDSKRVSNFIKNIKAYLVRHYQINKIGFVWAREKERAKEQHYHLALFLDGNKIQHPKKLLPVLKEKWLPFGHIPTISNPFYYIDKNNHTEQRAKSKEPKQFTAYRIYPRLEAKDIEIPKQRITIQVGLNRKYGSLRHYI